MFPNDRMKNLERLYSLLLLLLWGCEGVFVRLVTLEPLAVFRDFR